MTEVLPFGKAVPLACPLNSAAVAPVQLSENMGIA